MRSSYVILLLTALLVGCASPLAREPIPDDQVQSFVLSRIAGSINTGIFYLGTEEDLHHFRADRPVFGAEYFAIRRLAFKTPIEFVVGSRKPEPCYDWFTKDLKQQLSDADVEVLKKTIAVPLREAQASEGKK